MKTKKTKHANLENYRTIFFQIGLILTLTAILVSFEWKSSFEFKPIENHNQGYEIIDMDIPITKPQVEDQKKIEPPVFTLEPVENINEIEDIDLSQLVSDIDVTDAINVIEFAEPEEIVEEPIYYSYQVYPKFMGKDDNAFRQYIMDNIHFPVMAQEIGLTGKVQVQFVVGIDGSLSQIKILRGVDPSIDQEVLRVIANSPKWEPAIQSGNKVRAMYGIIISFELR